MRPQSLPAADVDAAPRELVDAIRARRPGGALLRLDRMLLHSPGLARGWNGMFGAIRGQLSLPARLRELAIVAVGVLNRADYERLQHEPELRRAGGSAAQLAALRRLRSAPRARLDPRRFDAAERATLTLAVEMTLDVRVKAATLRRVRALLPDPQVVELIGTIAGYNMVSRFVVATGLRPEVADRRGVTRRRRPR